MIPVKVDFRIPGLGADSRLVLFAGAALAGIAVQILVPGAFIVGLVLVALPLVMLTAKPWTNKPKDLGEEDWQPAGIPELDRLADAFRSARKIKIPFWYKPGSGILLTIVLGILTFFSGVVDVRVSQVFLNALLLLWPSLHFLRIRIWVPANLQMAMTCMQHALSINLPEDIVVTPYLRLDRDAQGLRIPEDVRLMIEPRRKKDDLVGIQLQAAINSGPNGAVPYMYAVVITNGKGSSWRVASATRVKGYQIEAGGDDEYGTVVVRQDTGGGGYHTDKGDCVRLMGIVLELTRALKA